ncbi:M23 family metallopeptidase [Candidatus Saganbacteria bacterium]|nr:M23 family metallopeptidase [Candidatus Saganbacteria bacterium]
MSNRRLKSRLNLGETLVSALIILVLFSSCFADIKLVYPAEVFQGRSFIVFIASPEAGNDYWAEFDNKAVRFYPYEEGLRAVIGTLPEMKTGDYDLKVRAKRPDQRLLTEVIYITVSRRIYPKVSFWLKPSKKKLMAPDLVTDEWGRIEAQLLKESPNKLWRGLFKLPVPGITTMAFGTREFVNNKPRSRHRGQDLRAPVGTRVLAPNRGQVIVAQFFKAFGGTVAIDHGQGIDTLYFHLSKIMVKEGQEVEVGDLLGLSGNTGISSGPHLHWGMSVHNVRVDPIQWVKTVMP